MSIKLKGFKMKEDSLLIVALRRQRHKIIGYINAIEESAKDIGTKPAEDLVRGYRDEANEVGTKFNELAKFVGEYSPDKMELEIDNLSKDYQAIAKKYWQAVVNEKSNLKRGGNKYDELIMSLRLNSKLNIDEVIEQSKEDKKVSLDAKMENCKTIPQIYSISRIQELDTPLMKQQIKLIIQMRGRELWDLCVRANHSQYDEVTTHFLAHIKPDVVDMVNKLLNEAFEPTQEFKVWRDSTVDGAVEKFITTKNYQPEFQSFIEQHDNMMIEMNLYK